MLPREGVGPVSHLVEKVTLQLIHILVIFQETHAYSMKMVSMRDWETYSEPLSHVPKMSVGAVCSFRLVMKMKGST